MSKIRIVLADDHPVVREGLAALIESQEDMEIVGKAADGRSACLLATQYRPDVAVLDVSMPEMGGVAATSRIREECPGVRVLALTVHEGDGYLRQLLGAGVSGYVLKRAAAEDLVRAIREVASGGTYIDPKLVNQFVLGFVDRARPTDRAEDELTEREGEVVRLVARGYINREIGDQLDVSVKTVEVHKSRALEKLGLRSRADLVRYALQRGWLYDTDTKV